MPSHLMADDIEGETAQSYSDMDVTHAHVGVKLPSGSTDGQATVEFDYDLNSPDALDLENDEVAELVAVDHNFVLQDRSAGTGQANPVTLITDYGYGINVEFGDLSAPRTDGTGEQATVVSSQNISGDVGTPAAFYDKAGLLYDARQQRQITIDNSSGAGSGGAAVIDHENTHYRERFGAGPFADASDELNVPIKVKTRGGDPEVKVEGSLTCYWDVFTVAGGRPSFAPPTGMNR